MDETNELMQERIKKLNRLKDSGVDPYGAAFDAGSKAADITERFGDFDKEALESKNEECSIAGRIISFRDFGKTAFAHIQDG